MFEGKKPVKSLKLGKKPQLFRITNVSSISIHPTGIPWLIRVIIDMLSLVYQRSDGSECILTKRLVSPFMRRRGNHWCKFYHRSVRSHFCERLVKITEQIRISLNSQFTCRVLFKGFYNQFEFTSVSCK